MGIFHHKNDQRLFSYIDFELLPFHNLPAFQKKNFEHMLSENYFHDSYQWCDINFGAYGTPIIQTLEWN